MSFNSINFLIFLPVVILVTFIIPKKFRYIWLLIASYFFYMSWNAKYSILILSATVISYFTAVFISKINDSALPDNKKIFNKKISLFISIAAIISVLVFFKYSNFIIEIISYLSALLHIDFSIKKFDILLPVGISFYTFQTVGYIIDVYRNEIKAESNFFKYALFVSFFPQLVAGPIERAKNILFQLNDIEKPKYENLKTGFLLILWGFFLKIVIADRISIFVDTVYADTNLFCGWYIIIATVLFAFQIYCDFYGYSVIALGSAKMLNIKIMDNFNAPYLALNVSDFWRKWHISLTSWLFDYIYKPLGGNKKGKLRKYINILIVFLISGIWHGASFSFVVWGGLNGLYLILEDLTKTLRENILKIFRINKDNISHKILQCILIFILIDITWIFFRAKSLSNAVDIINNIFTSNNISILFDGSLFNCGLDAPNFVLLIVSLLILFISDLLKNNNIIISEIILKQDLWFKYLAIIFIIFFILIFGMWGNLYNHSQFIYFQF